MTLTLPSASPLTRAERETIIRWDDEAKLVTLYTASPTVARKWTRLGHALTAVHHVNGQPTGWTGTAELRSVTVRNAKKRPAPPRTPPKRTSPAKHPS